MRTIKFKLIPLLLLLSGCLPNTEMLEELPPHLITAETLYINTAGFETGINGLYSLVRDEMVNGNEFIRANRMVGVDNMTANYPYTMFENIAQRWGTINNSQHRNYQDQFLLLYKIINAANTIISRANNEEIDWSGNGLTAEDNKNRVLAEARAFRAWAYRHLAYGWGDVPLTLEESNGANVRSDWERTPVAQVNQQVIEDFEFAEQHIPIEPEQSGRLTKGAIQTYLADVCLLMGNADRALFWADKAINTPQYQLVTERYGIHKDEPGVAFMDMFYEGNQNRDQGNSEALWVWQYEHMATGGSANRMRFFHVGRYFDIRVDGVTPLQLTFDRGGRGVGRMSMTKWAIELYEPEDDRGSEYAIRKHFILNSASENSPYAADNLPPGYAYGDTIFLDWSQDITFETKSRNTWPYSRKADAFPNPTNLAGSDSYNDFLYLRLAETYLLKAEAQFNLGDLTGAAETVNVLRRRANATEIAASDITIDFILDERSRELILEEDRRWSLLRTNKWLERTRKYNKNGGQHIQEKDKLFPIPQVVIDANLTNTMPQNDGY